MLRAILVIQEPMPERPSNSDFTQVPPEKKERTESEKKQPVKLEIRPPEDNGSHQHIILFECKSSRDRVAYDRATEMVLEEEMVSRSKEIDKLRGSISRPELQKIPGVTFVFHQINASHVSGWEVQGPGITTEYLSDLFERIHKKAEEYPLV